jgi:soluble lytic murein transglycosylase-like protein
MTNDDLSQYAPSGASMQTARQDGLDFSGPPASQHMARTDENRVMRYRSRFESAAARLALPSALLAAIASRESRGGAVLDAAGWGDRGNAFGIMQVDRISHEVRGDHDPGSQEHIDQAAEILVRFLAAVRTSHPSWPSVRALQGAVAAYNSGPANVRTLGGMDVGTTGDDYSNDVWARALYYVDRI